LIALIVEALNSCPHSSSVIALTLRVLTPWTYCAFAVYFRKRKRDDYGRGEKVSDPKMKEIGD
jgi:hypothetical protein